VRKLNAKELREYRRDKKNKKDEKEKIKKNPIFIVLDNVLDSYNVGSIFRLADAVAAKQILLCGETQIPPNSRIKKASINTTEVVDWQYFDSAKSAVENLVREIRGIRVIGVEQNKGSVPYTKTRVELPVALVVGNESYGVSKEVLEMCDEIVEIPMWGVNKSLNVMVSLGIILYKLMESVG